MMTTNNIISPVAEKGSARNQMHNNTNKNLIIPPASQELSCYTSIVSDYVCCSLVNSFNLTFSFSTYAKTKARHPHSVLLPA